MSFLALLVETLLVFAAHPFPVSRIREMMETLATIIDDIRSPILTIAAGKVVGPLKSIIIGEMD